MNVRDLKLNARACNCLLAENLEDAEQVAAMSDLELRRIPNIGKLTLKRIRAALKRAGVKAKKRREVKEREPTLKQALAEVLVVLRRVDDRFERLNRLVRELDLNGTTFAGSMQQAINHVDALSAERAVLRQRLGLEPLPHSTPEVTP